MRTISSNLLNPERSTLHENVAATFRKAGAINKSEFEKSFMFLDNAIPYDTNDRYDLSIFYKNNIFLIRFASLNKPRKHFSSNREFVEYVEKHMAVFSNAMNTNKFIETAKEYGAIPCLMLIDLTTMQPVKVTIGNKTSKDGKLLTVGQVYRWGLINARTLEPIDPNNMKWGKDDLMTSWEERIFAINFVCERLKEDNDCRILYVDDRERAEPNIWFRNASGELCWVQVAVGFGRYVEEELDRPMGVFHGSFYPGTGYTTRVVFTKLPRRSHHCTGCEWKWSNLRPIEYL